MKINQKISKYNHEVCSSRDIDWIVIHYVGSVSKAKDNATYFAGGDRQASAHYFVDDDSIWQSVLNKNIAWHCGGGLQGTSGHKYFRKCGNFNSIGIEMCCKKNKAGSMYISSDTIKLTGQLVRSLMKKYDIPASHVIRHYDVTGKKCPAMYVNETKWKALRKKLTTTTATTTAKVSSRKYTGTLPTLPERGYFKSGDYSLQVKRLQNFLNWYGNYKLDPDKSYGPDTIAAVKKYEKALGLEQDGLFGKKCLNKAKDMTD